MPTSVLFKRLDIYTLNLVNNIQNTEVGMIYQYSMTINHQLAEKSECIFSLSQYFQMG